MRRKKISWVDYFDSPETFLQTPESQQFAQNAKEKIEQSFMADPRFLPLQNDILKHFRDDKNIPFCQEHRAKMYHFYQSADYPKGVYRVCSGASYRSGKPDWKILFDVAQFEKILGEDVYLDGVSHNVLNPESVLLTLSPQGQDAAYTLEFDLEAGVLVENGFHFPLGKNHITWRDENSVWVCPAWHEAQLTQSGYPREVWLLERGQGFDEALPLLQTDKASMMVHAWRYLDGKGSPIDLIEEAASFFQKKYYIVQDSQPCLLNLPDTAEIVGYLAGQLLVRLVDDWKRSNRDYRAGSLLAVGLHKGELAEAKVLFEPGSRQTLETVETTKNFIVIHILDHVCSRLLAWRFEQGNWEAVNLPSLPSGTIEVVDQPWGGDIVYLAISDFLMPLTLVSLDLHYNELTILRRAPAVFQSQGYQSVQYQAQSADGTMIPYFWVGSEQAPDTPTLVYVYGGFEVSELPYYLGSVGRHWLEKGGAFVVANVRGGGEFGPSWHQAAQGKNKYKSVDDLLAIVLDLIQSGKSSPAKIALQGGSNGGLLVASAFTRAPELLGAVVSEMPLTDMLHYPEWSAGSSWLEEYGNPEQEEERAALLQLSPFHQLREHQIYPPIMVTTALSDDRVHPLHAFKFAARLIDLQQDAWLYQSDNGGHEGNQTQEDDAKELAVIWVFLYQALRMA